MLQMMRCIKDYLGGLGSRVKRDPTDEDSIEGKIVLITGANSGIGKATAAEMASRGATVIMACRNLDLAKEALVDIRKRTQNGDLILMELDLGDLTSIRSFAKEFQQQYSELNILINNAGVSDQNGILHKTKDGFESHMGINHLGHFLLTNLLLETLGRGSPSRVISVASFFYSTSDLKIEDLMLEHTDYLGFGNIYPYGNSKLANMLFIKGLAKRVKDLGINTYAVCPGMTNTNVFRTQPGITNFFTKLSIKCAGFSPEEACEIILLCALSKKLSSETGEMYRFGKRWEHVMERLDDQLVEQLWEKSQQFVGQN